MTKNYNLAQTTDDNGRNGHKDGGSVRIESRFHNLDKSTDK